MSETQNGVIGGSGIIDKWKSEYNQTGPTGISAQINVVDLQTLLQAPNTPTHNEFTLTSYEGGTISGLDYYSSSYYQDERIAPWLFAMGIKFTRLVNDNKSDKANRFVLPFGNYFQGFNSYSPQSVALYSNSKYNNYITDNYVPNYDWYGIGSTGFADRYDELYFAWLSADNYKGYITMSCNHEKTNYDYSYRIWNISNVQNILGTFTMGETPETDPEKGIPSLPIGGAGDLTKKRVDEVTLPDMPTFGVSTTGALNVYRVGLNDLNNFISEIFHTSVRRDYSGTDFGEMLANGLINIDNAIKDTVNGDITNFVVDMHIIPVEPDLASSPTNIHIGGFSLDTLGRPVASDYVDVSYGSITLDKANIPFYDGASDLTGARYKLYIPYIGFVDVPPSYCWSHTLTLRMRFNIIDGSCMAFLSSSILSGGDTSIIGVYSGSCCVHMPITGQNYSNVISGMLQAVGGFATSNPISGVKGVLDMAKPNITMSNGYNASTSFMGIRKPYLLIEKPTQCNASNFYELNGGYVNAQYKLETLRDSGYTTCKNVDPLSLGNIKTSEKMEIKRLLESGVYL